MDTDLGRILRERRIARKLPLRQLEEMSGVSRSYISRVEIGERFPSARALRSLAKPLGFGEIELFKIAGFLSRDESDDRVARFKEEIKREIARSLVGLRHKVNSL